jgi:hypothetical protein
MMENPTIWKPGNWKPNPNNLQTKSPTKTNNLQIGNPKNAIMWTLETQPQPNNLQIRNPTLTPTMYKLETPTPMNYKLVQQFVI